MKAFISLGKQLHQYQIHEFKNLFHILESNHIHKLISLIFHQTFSAKLAISFIKLIFVAKKEFDAYFIISADFISVKIIFVIFLRGLYISSIISFDFSLATQQTILSGFKKSHIAFHSLKNSGLEATSKS
jgi:hypothetical protein